MGRGRAFQDRVVWLTGASKGIGRALALELAARGARLALSARTAPELDALVQHIGGERAAAFPLDVTDRAATHDTVAAIEQRFGGVDVAVLNAGTAEYVDVHHFDAGVFERMMRINVLSVAYGVEAVLPLLRRAPQPHLVGVSSAVAYAGLPKAEAYGASKAAVRNMLQGLRIHLRAEGIAVSVVCPGFVRTPLTDLNDFPMPLRIEAERAARLMADGMARRAQEIHFPKLFTLTYRCLAVLPAPLYTRLLAFTAPRHGAGSA